MYAKKHSTHKGLFRGVVLLLSVVLLLTSLQLGGLAVVAENADAPVIRYGDTAVDSIVLPQEEKRTLTVEEIEGAAYQWQICADAEQELWVRIRGQKQNFLTFGYATVGSVLDQSSSVQLRCVVTADGESCTSAPVKVTVSYTVPDLAQTETAAPVLRAPRRDAPAEGDLTSYTITVNFVYEDGSLAWDPYVATIEAGGAFKDTVRFPEVIGYLPYFGNEENSTTQHVLDIPEMTENLNFTVIYKPTVVSFKVHHYQQNILDDNYVLYSTTTAQGLTNVPVGGNREIVMDGFTALYYDKDVRIAADGSTEIEIYYDRNYYLVTFDLDGGYGTEPVYARYGTTVSVNPPTKPGYVFGGWELTECGGETPSEAQKTEYDLNKNSITLPSMNLKYQAKWETANTSYTVVYWAENADDDNYSYLGSKSVDAKSATRVSGQDDFNWTEKQHFTYNADRTDKEVTVEGDRSTVVNVYYTRNTYTLTFKEGGAKVLSCGKVEHQHSDSCCKYGGTSLSHWYHRDSCCKLGLSEHSHSNNCYKNSDVIITAKYQADIHGNFPIKDGNDTIWWKVPQGTETYGDSDEQRYLGSIDTMPGENITFEKNDSESGAKIYYYVETINGAAGDTTHGDRNYKQYKVIDLDYSSSTSLTYREEFHPITGFTQGDSNPYLPKDGSVKMQQNNYLYYTRNSYSLQFYSYNEFVTSKETSVQYEAPLSGYNFTPDYPVGMEPNAYEFAGWYTTPGCYAGSEVDWETMTMPASDVTLYAKWAPKTHTVRVFRTSDMTEAELLVTQKVLHGNLAKAPDDVANGNYVFNGWFYYDDNGEKKAFDFNNMPVNRDLDIFAEWSSKTAVLYTIRYELKDGTPIAEPTVGSTLAGASKTFTAKAGTELYAGYQEGYFPNTNSHTLLMNINGGNEYTFVYVAMPNAPYTVRYLEKGTGTVLHEEKHVDENKKVVVTEIFEAVSGYMPDAYQKRLVLSANPEENVLTFWYTRDTEHAYYAIIHWVQNLEGDGYTEYRTIQSPGKIGAEITEAPLTLTGFTYNADKSTSSGTLTAEGLVLNLYYDRNEYTYIVRYLEYGTDRVLHDQKITEETYRYGKVVSEDAIDIPGYTVVGASTKTRTIRTSANEIIFYYNEQEVTINYVAVPAEGGSVSRASETIKASTGEAQGSVPTAKNGYRFAGWYTDEACKNSANQAWIDGENKLTPEKSEGLYRSATYYAKFVKDTANLEITKTGAEAIDENQTFLFRVKGVESDENTRHIDLTVTIHGNGSVKITELPVGAYTVTELTGWSWRYKPDEGKQTVTLDPNGSNIVRFANRRENTQWLDGDNYNVNIFN